MKNFLKFITILLFVSLTSCTDEQSLILSKKNSVLIISNLTEKAMGTGFFVEDNLIVTNYHIIKTPESELQVTMENSTESFDVEFVAGDSLADIAFLRLKNIEQFSKSFPEKTNFEIKKIPLKTLESVYVIGHPWGLHFSISKGVVSYFPRKPPIDTPMWYIQTDAHVFQGNSGGPMVDKNGNLVGINVMMISNNGGSYGLAIPIPILQKVKNDLEKYKEVRWAKLGIQLGKNLIIDDIVPDSAAAEAGLFKYDQVLGLYHNSKFHKFSYISEVPILLSTVDYQDEVYLLIYRNGVEIKLPVKLKYRTSAEFAPPSPTMSIK